MCLCIELPIWNCEQARLLLVKIYIPPKILISCCHLWLIKVPIPTQTGNGSVLYHINLSSSYQVEDYSLQFKQLYCFVSINCYWWQSRLDLGDVVQGSLVPPKSPKILKLANIVSVIYTLAYCYNNAPHPLYNYSLNPFPVTVHCEKWISALNSCGKYFGLILWSPSASDLINSIYP